MTDTKRRRHIEGVNRSRRKRLYGVDDQMYESLILSQNNKCKNIRSIENSIEYLRTFSGIVIEEVSA